MSSPAVSKLSAVRGVFSGIIFRGIYLYPLTRFRHKTIALHPIGSSVCGIHVTFGNFVNKAEGQIVTLQPIVVKGQAEKPHVVAMWLYGSIGSLLLGAGLSFFMHPDRPFKERP